MKKIIGVTIVFVSCALFFSLLFAGEQAGRSKLPAAQDKYSKILVCSKALEALSKIGSLQAKDILTRGLKSEEFFVRASAVEGLGRLKDKEAVPLLKGLISDESYLVRILAVKVLLEMGEADMEKPLLDFLVDSNPEVRANAAEQLGDFGNKYSLELSKVLSGDDSYLVRAKAIAQLGINKFAPAAEAIRQAIKDEHPQVRQAACFAIGNMGGKEGLALIRERLNDEDVSVRAAAKEVISLLEEEGQASIKLLWQDLESNDPLLQASSFIALANLKDINILPVLLKKIIAPKEQSSVRLQAGRALSILRPSVLRLVDTSLARSKAAKAGSLSLEEIEINYKVNGQSLVSILTGALKDEKDPLYQDAALILGVLNERIALPALREALFQGNPEMVATVAYVLGEFQDKDAVSYLIQACEKYGL